MLTTEHHRPGLPRVLRRRNFRLFFSAQLLSALGDGVVLVAIGFAVLDATGSIAALAKVMAARFIPLSLLVLFGGVLADRLPRRVLMVASCIVRAVAQVCFAALLLTDHATLPTCVAVQALYGSAEAFFRPAMMGLVPQIVTPDELQQANSLDEMTYAMSRILGPAFGGLLVIAFGSAGAMAADASVLVLSALLLVQIRVPIQIQIQPDGHQNQPHETVLRQLVEGFGEVRQRSWIWVSTLNFAVFGALTIPAVLVLGPELAWRELDGVPGWTAVTVAFGAGALAGSAAALRLPVVRPGVVLGVMLTVAALRPAFFVSGFGLPVVAGYCFLAGAAMSIASCVWALLLQRNVPRAALGRVSAFDEFGTSVLTPIGYLIAVPLAASVGLDRGVLLLAALPVATSLATVAIGQVRRLRWAPA
jgi:MFS family permease